MKEETLFEAARQLPFQDRDAFLQRECPDPLLRQLVEALLAADAQSISPIDGVRLDSTQPFVDPNSTSAFSSTPQVPNPPESEGMSIAGRYKLLQSIGEGGMGSVYLAEQTEPVKRHVALKLIKAGMDSRTVLARFDAERQALALMDHPHIARIFDGGMTESGQPFFVMEYVQGVPISKYCDSERLNVSDRLQLFIQVCQAVQHAHQKGIIHRDLKPGNILVTEIDGRPSPKVIDFGVAKATEQKLTDLTLDEENIIVGTPAYMSPEQADPSSMDVDTRSDVYALGIILYELLTGSPPIDAKQFRRGAILEVLRMVREVDPPRPSTKLSTAEALPSIAANRSVEPMKLTRMLRGELDWVVMKAIEKDRNRRYDSANGLALELMRYLAGEAVEAHPPSKSYRLKKFVKRNRGQVIAGSLVFSLLVVAVVGTSIGLVEAKKQTKLALEAAEKEKYAKEQEKLRADGEARAKLLAEERRQEAEDLADFFRDVFRSPEQGRNGRTITVAETLDRAAKKLESDLTTQPGRRAKFQAALGGTYWALGLPLQAIPLLEQAQAYHEKIDGESHPETLNVYQFLGAAYETIGRYSEAIQLVEKVYMHQERNLGAGHERTIWAMSHLGNMYSQLGRNQEALDLREKIYQIAKQTHGKDHSTTLGALGNLSNSYSRLGDHNQALEVMEKVLAGAQKSLGKQHQTTLNAMDNIVLLYKRTGRPQDAIQLSEKLLPMRAKVDGATHPNTLTTKSILASLYDQHGRAEDALRLREEILQDQKKVLGTANKDTIATMKWLGTQYSKMGRLPDEIRMHEEILAATKQLYGPQHSDVAYTLRQLNRTYAQNGQRAKSVDASKQLILDRIAKDGPDHPEVTKLLLNSSSQWLKEAVLAAWNDQDTEVAFIADSMLQLFHEVKFADALERTAKVCSLVIASDPKRQQQALQLAERAMKLHPDQNSMTYARMTLGMSQYRGGDYKAALTTLKPGAKSGNISGPIAFYRAMTLYQLGKTDEARELFHEVEKAMKPLPKKPLGTEEKSMNTDEMIVWLAHRQAKRLLIELLPSPRIQSENPAR